MRRRDNIRQTNDIWVKLSEKTDISKINHIDWDFVEQDLIDFDSLSDEELNFYIQYSVLPLKDNRIVVYSTYIRIPEHILKENPTILLWEKDKINSILENKIRSKSKITFSKETKSLEAIKKILAKMQTLECSDITISWRRDKVVISYAIHGKNIKDYEDIIDIDFADKLRLSLINISYENQASKLIDGKFSLYILGKIREYRLSGIETVAGHSLVIRSYNMFDKETTLDSLNYLEKPKKIIQNIINENPYGVFLITGPTGSGKTTTIYTILNEQFKKHNLKIKTAEDPVEVEIDGIDQCQINEKGDKENRVDYVSLLRSFMRQRPDIIAIGEIRDSEVAKTTIEAALTGHKVISTLHTNNIEATFTRLIENLNISIDRIEDSMSGVLSQRLVDKLCECKIKSKDSIGFERNESGCDLCRNNIIKGYNGQIPAVEVARMKKDIDNYKKENFLEYYSYNDSAEDLYSLGLIDKNTKKLINLFQ